MKVGKIEQSKGVFTIRRLLKSIGLSFAKEPYKRDDILQQVAYIHA